MSRSKITVEVDADPYNRENPNLIARIGYVVDIDYKKERIAIELDVPIRREPHIWSRAIVYVPFAVVKSINWETFQLIKRESPDCKLLQLPKWADGYGADLKAEDFK